MDITNGFENIGSYQAFDAFPRQCIIAGKRGSGPHTVTADEANNYFFKGLVEHCVCEGRQFCDYENTIGYSNVPFLDTVFTTSRKNALIINASVCLTTPVDTTRRYAKLQLINPEDESADYDLNLMAGNPDSGGRINFACTTIVTPSAFNHLVWPTLSFYLQEGDIIGWWGITAILQ